MFAQIEPLEFIKHRDLRLSSVSGFGFAQEVTCVKLSFSEFRQASRYYPIVFLEDSPFLPQALLSLNNSESVCIDKNGQWKFPYIPAFFRLYPFTLAKIQEKENEYALCLDPQADHFKVGMGEPLFTADGELSDFLKNNIQKNLEIYHSELESTESVFREMDEMNLFENKSFSYTFAGEEKKIEGFKGINLEKLKELSDKDLARMARQGNMGLIHEHVNSFSSFNNLIAASLPPIPGLEPAEQ